MNIIVSVAVLALQRVPFVNRIPAIANVGTIDHAIKSLNKAVANLEDVATNQGRAAGEQQAIIDAATAARDAALKAEQRAKRVAGKVADLLS